MNRDEYFMSFALREAKKAYDKGEVPVGCVIVKNDKIISRGHNQVLSKKSGVYHAEIIAINKAGKKLGDFRLEDTEIFVTLEPCCMCAGAIVNSRIKRVVIGTMDPKRGFCGSIENVLDRQEMNHKSIIETKVLEKECLEILQDFFKILRSEKKNKWN